MFVVFALFLAATVAHPRFDGLLNKVPTDWCSLNRYCDEGYHCCNVHTCCRNERYCCKNGYCCKNNTHHEASPSLSVARSDLGLNQYLKELHPNP
nr:uncharacterized protein LOC106692465 [Halyomorpha halys]